MRDPGLSLYNFVAMDGISKWDEDKGVFHIETPHALAQISGYAKFQLAPNGPVYFRGQTSHYPTMRPSLFRKDNDKIVLSPTLGSCSQRTKELMLFIKSEYCQNAFLTNTPSECHEPILQHYGLKTRWIDVVDNIWSALWFSLHKTNSISNGRYINFSKTEEELCYVYLLQFGQPNKKITNGISTTNQGMTIADLRIATPSTYLRPHSQHGLLAMRRSLKAEGDQDYSDCVIMTMEIQSAKAKEWLGTSLLAQDHYMFPSPQYDIGYRILLENNLTPPPNLGNISHIGA